MITDACRASQASSRIPSSPLLVPKRPTDMTKQLASPKLPHLTALSK
jgi:hypothetical protein